MRHAFKTESTPLNFILHTSDNGEPWAINQRTFDILSTYLQDDTTLSPTDVAKNIDELFPLNRPQEGDQENEDVTSFLLEMWGVVICLAEQIPWDDPRQKKLVEVIQALKDLPGPKTIQMDDWGAYAVWLDLPLLGPALIENGSSINLEDMSDAQRAIRFRQQNFQAFAAHLTQRGLVDMTWQFAIYSLAEALEQEPDRRAKMYIKQGPRLEAYVPLAGIWILFAGNVIFGHCCTPRTVESGDRGRNRNWKGPNGFSIERWNFWKKRFGEIKEHDQAGEKIKEIAAEAEDAMIKFESISM